MRRIGAIEASGLRRSFLAFACAGGFGTFPCALAAEPEGIPLHRLYRVQIGADHTLLDRLVAKGFDIAGRNIKNGTIDILAHSDAEARELRALSEQILASWTVDADLAPAADYKTPLEVEAILQDFATRYPSLMTLESIGKTVEGRDIWAAKITGPEAAPGTSPKPSILFNALHHAREVMTPEVALDTLDQLLTRYDQDPQITHWVNANEIWIVPMVNPDGSHKVWTRNSTWRKNTRGGYGVDINRNYPYAWNTCNGSSGSTGSDTYRGPSAGSEPETQALMALVEKIQPVFDISYHSYSELVLYPYGCNGHRADAAAVIEPLGKAMAALLPSDTGTGTYDAGTSWELLYSVDGSDIDWMYHDQHVIPYVIEVNSDREGFQPAYAWRQPTVEKMRAAWHLLFDRLDQSGMRGVVTDETGARLRDLPLTVQQIEASTAATLVQTKTKKNGSFHVILNPGRYRVTFGSGARQVTRDIMIGEDRIDLNLVL